MTAYATRFAAVAALVLLFGGAVGYFAGYRAGTGETSRAAVPVKVAAAEATSLGPREIDQAREARDSGAPSTRPLAKEELEGRIVAAARGRDFFRRRHDIYELGQRLDREDIRAAMDLTQVLPEAICDFTQYPLLARWLELDPTAAYEWIGALPKPGRRSELMREFFHSMGLKDPGQALSFLDRYRMAPDVTEDFTSSVFEAWSTWDLPAAVDAAFNVVDRKAQESAVEACLQPWAKRDPLGALGRIAQLPDAESRRSHTREILQEWAKEDADGATSYALGLENERERHQAVASVISAIAAKDADAALRLVDQLPPGSIRTNAVTSVLTRIANEEPETAAEFLLALPPAVQGQWMHMVASQFARRDPGAALAWADQVGSVEARKSARSQIIRAWSEEDPKAAAEYCASSPETDASMLHTVVGNWAEKDAQAALAWSRALPAGALREGVLGNAVATMAEKDPAQAAALAMTLLSGEDVKRETLDTIAEAWGAKDPQAAAAWAAQLNDPSVREDAMASVADGWAREDPAAAAAWALRSPGNRYLLANVARNWATVDSTAAANWLSTLPLGANRDGAVLSFSHAITGVDPEAAAAWASSISEPGQRESAIVSIYQHWQQLDPKRAGGWLRTTPAVSKEIREQLLREN